MRLRALIIDDCSQMRSLLMQLLPLTGLAQFEFTEAADGADGLRQFDPRKTDIVFVDWQMPRLQGIDFVRQARAATPTMRIPMVMVSGKLTIGEVEEILLEAGVDEYVAKPFTVETLRKRLGSLIDAIARERR